MRRIPAPTPATGPWFPETGGRRVDGWRSVDGTATWEPPPRDQEAQAEVERRVGRQADRAAHGRIATTPGRAPCTASAGHGLVG